MSAALTIIRTSCCCPPVGIMPAEGDVHADDMTKDTKESDVHVRESWIRWRGE
jgi:hypothetical protein